jgi:hypothetical protein
MLRRVMVLILFGLTGIAPACFANISLSVNPVDGTNSLRFESIAAGSIGNKKEIHIRVNSTNGDRYQVFQRVIEPIMDPKGNALNLQAIEVQTLSNSNSYGTLYLQNSDHLNMSDQLLYSSSQNGQSDSFLIGYSLDHNLITSGGSFRGRIVFTVRGLGNGSNDQSIIDVFLNSSSQGLKLSIKGGHDQNRVHIHGSDTTEQKADFINVSFSGNPGQEIRIYQEVENMPQNETDQELGADVLQLDAEGQTDGLRTQGLSSLGSSKTLIYSSNKAEDNFIIYFLVNADQVQQQDAGSYVGRIKYLVETSQGDQEIPMDIQCDIPPVFSINVVPPAGGVSFSHVLANNPPQDKEVTVTVLSNLHKPYQVLQDLQTNMTNKQGKELDSKYFTVQVEIPSGQKGQTNFTEFSPVQTGEYPVFTSDSRGSGATFEVVYRLQGYAQMSPGDFLAPLRFSLNQK